MATEEKKVRGFEMFSKAGNSACNSLVESVIKKISGTKRVTEEELNVLLRKRIAKIAEKHSEVYDTEPPEHIVYYINQHLKSVGYGFELDKYKICFA